jgi:hypothetical protein
MQKTNTLWQVALAVSAASVLAFSAVVYGQSGSSAASGTESSASSGSGAKGLSGLKDLNQ